MGISTPRMRTPLCESDSSSFSVVATFKVTSGARISKQVKHPNVKLISGTNVSLFLAQVS